MATFKFSVNKKLNAVLNDILDSLVSIHDTPEESLEEVRHYMESFPHEIDFNLAQYGNMLIYYHDIRKMYKDAGYTTIDSMTDDMIWETYKRQTGYVARIAIKNNLIVA